MVAGAGASASARAGREPRTRRDGYVDWAIGMAARVVATRPLVSWRSRTGLPLRRPGPAVAVVRVVEVRIPPPETDVVHEDAEEARADEAETVAGAPHRFTR